MSGTFIHIGYPKTATTWFIRYFYPFVTNINPVFSDKFEYSTEPQNPYFWLSKNIKSNEKFPDFIISHKFSGFEEFRWDGGYYRQFYLTQLKKNFPGASIIIFLRNQVDFLASAYSSYLTHGGTYTFQELFKAGKLSDGKMFSFEYLDYYRVIKEFEALFGKGNVHIFLYEDFQNDNRQFLMDYAHKFGLDVNLDKIKFTKYNDSLRKRLACLVRLTNRFGKSGVIHKKYIINVPWLSGWPDRKKIISLNRYKIFGNKLRTEDILGKELILHLQEFYKEPNRRLINEYGLDSIKKYSYPL